MNSRNTLYIPKILNQKGGRDVVSKPKDTPVEKKIDIPDSTNLKPMDTSHMTLYTIPRGTLLYHGSKTKETFNPHNIVLNDKELVAFFSPNKRMAADYVDGCAKYPKDNGFIHIFVVKKDITKLKILSQYDLTKKFDEKEINDKFCSRDHRPLLNGIGLFFPMMKIDIEDIIYKSEFALCDPNEYLEYVGTQKCISKRKMGEMYSFTRN